MAWNTSGFSLSMTEGDYGIELPVKVNGVTLGAQDTFRFTFKTAQNGQTVLEKDYSNISQNTVPLKLTEEESALFSVGLYVYSLDWYQSGVFMCNLVPVSTLKVVDKA